jgi:hypothetical protein
LYRWYAGCCNTPVANSANAKLPFAGVVHNFIDFQDAGKREQVLGPVFVRIFGKYGIAPLPEGTHPKTPVKLMLKFVPFMIKGVLKKAHNPNPFFDASTGQPKVESYVLTKDERNSLRAQLPKK